MGALSVSAGFNVWLFNAFSASHHFHLFPTYVVIFAGLTFFTKVLLAERNQSYPMMLVCKCEEKTWKVVSLCCPELGEACTFCSRAFHQIFKFVVDGGSHADVASHANRKHITRATPLPRPLLGHAESPTCPAGISFIIRTIYFLAHYTAGARKSRVRRVSWSPPPPKI